jgi:hypothetical protein
MVGNQSSEYRKRSVMENLLQDIGVHFNEGNLMFANDMLAKNPRSFYSKAVAVAHRATFTIPLN